MPENGLMKYITIAAIVFALYLLLSKKNKGTVAQISPNATSVPPPGDNACCNSPLISVNDPIPIATDYLPNVPAAGGRSLIRPINYGASTSPIVARAVKSIPVMPQPVATMQNVAQPYGVSQSNCVPGISAAQAQKIFKPATKVTVLSGSTGMICIPSPGCIGGSMHMFPVCHAGCYASGHCGPNLRCLICSGAATLPGQNRLSACCVGGLT